MSGEQLRACMNLQVIYFLTQENMICHEFSLTPLEAEGI